MDRLLLIGLMLALSACGGGGGEGGGGKKGRDDWENTGFVSINPPDRDTWGNRAAFTQLSSGAFETELTHATFNGGVSVSSSAECNRHTGFDVTVTNAATGEISPASERVDCSLIVRNGRWQAPSVPLEVGSNRLTASGAGATASITVIRINLPPEVDSVLPADGSTDVALTGAEISVIFSDDLDPATVTSDSFVLEDATGTTVAGAVAYEPEDKDSGTPSRATFTANEELQPGTLHTARLTTDIADTYGDFLESEFSWTFRSFEDVTPPMQVVVTPAEGDHCVAPDKAIAVRFDEPIDPASLTSSSFSLENSTGTPMPGSVVLSDLVATFTPATPLDLGETYTAKLGSAITDAAGNALAPESWSFATPYDAKGTWTSIATATNLAPRGNSSAVWTGSEMIVWGGGSGNQAFGDGARYNPVADQWTDMSSVGAPSPRSLHTATWTGTEMIVWGGKDQTLFADGARYDPASDTWQPMSTDLAPSVRTGHSAVWTGTELIVWGGQWQAAGYEFSGARYDPATDTWTPMSTINAPSPRTDHYAMFDGERMIVWGGSTSVGDSFFKANDGGIYDPVADMWTPIFSFDAPSTAVGSVVQAGRDLFVWSRYSEWVVDPFYNRGSWETVSEPRRYESELGMWLAVTESCESTAIPNAVWANGRMLSWNDDFSEGYAYDEVRDIWHPITALPVPVSTGTTVIAIGESVIVWDGAREFPNVGFRLTL